MVSETLGGGVLSDADSFRRISLGTENRITTESEGVGQPVRADGAPGEGVPGGCGSESGLGGMAYGLPAWMDGHALWKREPDGIPRMTTEKELRTERLSALGNAVVPQQVYPVLKYIADIESGRCRDWRPPGEESGVR
jgi:DNA (cytosine-5)-methyltransferase 1